VSFSFQAAGTVEQARAQIDAATIYGENPQATAVKGFILSELAAWPADTPGRRAGVIVEANGHHDDYCRNVTLTMRTLWLPDEPAKPVPDPA